MTAASRVQAILAACIAVSSCGKIFPGSAPKPQDLIAATDTSLAFVSATFLVVENRNWQNITVFLQHDGLVSRLGMVNTARTETYRIEQLLGSMGEVRLIAEPTAGGRTNFSPRIQTDRIVVRPGQTISWLLEGDLKRSSLEVH